MLMFSLAAQILHLISLTSLLALSTKPGKFKARYFGVQGTEKSLTSAKGNLNKASNCTISSSDASFCQ